MSETEFICLPPYLSIEAVLNSRNHENN